MLVNIKNNAFGIIKKDINSQNINAPYFQGRIHKNDSKKKKI